MKKATKVETREERIERAKGTLKEVPTSTKVKAWTFQVDKTFYVIISFFAPRYGQQMSVHLSNRKGIKISNEEIASLRGKDDANLMFDTVIQKLIPEMTTLEKVQEEMKNGIWVPRAEDLVYKRAESVPAENE